MPVTSLRYPCHVFKAQTVRPKPDWRESFCVGRIARGKQNLDKKRDYRYRSITALHFQINLLTTRLSRRSAPRNDILLCHFTFTDPGFYNSVLQSITNL
jgi:hypothetical protein